MSIVAQGQSARTLRSDYETPREFVTRVEALIGMRFGLDVAATIETAKAPNYFGPDREVKACRDALEAPDWRPYVAISAVWMNPPYGPRIGRWVQRAGDAAVNGATVVGLLPGNAWGSRWWTQSVLGTAHEIVPITGRIRFLLDGVVQPAPANDNVLVIWRPGRRPPVPMLCQPIAASIA